MSKDQTKPQESKPETTIQMSLNFKTTYDWDGTDYTVHLADQYSYFTVRITFTFEYDDAGKLCRRDIRGVVEISNPVKALAQIDRSTAISRKHFFSWAEMTTAVEALPGWLRSMVDMRRVRRELDAVPPVSQ